MAKQSNTKNGDVRGQHVRYVAGHYRHRPSDRYVVEDRGYETPCWVWQGQIIGGYPYLSFKHRTIRAHRYYYAQRFGEIPEGMHVHHRCEVPSCVNPDHLEAITPVANIRMRRTTKLSEQAVAEIRELVDTMTQAEIADRYGVDPSNISRIAAGTYWR